MRIACVSIGTTVCWGTTAREPPEPVSSDETHEASQKETAGTNKARNLADFEELINMMRESILFLR